MAILTKRRHNRPKEIQPIKEIAEKISRHPAFRKLMSRRVKISRTYDIPYLAGYSEDGLTIYFDRNFKPLMSKDVDTTDFLLVHEKAEKACLILFKMRYQQAHDVATYLEHKAVVEAGISWKEYSDYLEPYIRKTDRQRVRRVPKDLDLQPYRDEHDVRHLRAMKKVSRSSTVGSEEEKPKTVSFGNE